MHSRPFRSLSAAAVTSFLLLGLVPLAGAAGEKDKEATKLFDQAMNEDYLNTDFAKAEKKLKDALKRCGGDGCSAGVVGKIHVALGTLYGVGQNKPDQAREEFVTALKADPKAVLDEALSNPDLAKIFNDAKKSVSPGKGPDDGTEKPARRPSGGGGDLATHTAPTEQVVNTPIPLYLEPTDEAPLSKVTLRYKPFGAKQYKSVELKKVGKGFGGEIPCEDVTTTGDVRYFFALTDENGEAVGTLGSTKEPFKITIKSEIEGDAPSLPGKKPPEQCREKADCPPGLPGCPAATGGKRGEKGWGSSCEETQQCQAGLICLNGSCEEGKDDSSADAGATKKKFKHHTLALGVQLDALVIASKENVCSTPKADEPSNYVCFLANTSNQFNGTPAQVNTTNGIDGGFKLASTRILASYSYLFSQNIPISVGVQLGWALGGSPTPGKENHDQVEKARRFLPAKSFLGFHGEVRGAYHFAGSTLDKLKFRPYAFLGFGVGQVNGGVPVQVCDTATGATGNACSSKDPAQGKRTVVDAYQITGLNFLDFGGGTTFGITPNFGFSAEVKFMLMLPTFGFVLAPTVGPVFAF